MNETTVAAVVALVGAMAGAYTLVRRGRREDKQEARVEAEHLAVIRGMVIGELKQQIADLGGRLDQMEARFEEFRQESHNLLRAVLEDLERVPPDLAVAVGRIRRHLTTRSVTKNDAT